MDEPTAPNPAKPRRYRLKLTAAEIDHYVRVLARTGNVTLAAETAGRHKTTFIKLKRRDPAFAVRCDAAIAEFRLAAVAGRGPSTIRFRDGPPPLQMQGRRLKCTRGELVLVHGRTRPQIRRAGGGELNRAGVDAFLRTLAGTGNVRLSAAAVGVAPNAIRQRRLRDARFDEAVSEKLRMAYVRLEAALVESGLRGLGEGHPDADDMAELPPMSVDQALMLLTHHRRTCGYGWETKRAPARGATDAEIVQALSRRLRCWSPPKG